MHFKAQNYRRIATSYLLIGRKGPENGITLQLYKIHKSLVQNWEGEKYNKTKFQMIIKLNYFRLLNFMILRLRMNPKNFHLIGHSLGAHIVSYVSHHIKGKVGRITGKKWLKNQILHLYN
jgi:hypothetical protein